MSEKNVELWSRINSEFTDADARRAWAEERFSWGIWGVPESELGVFGDVSGLDALELGCGTAYCSARLARMGARVAGVDPTPAQLETARRMQAEFGLFGLYRLDWPDNDGAVEYHLPHGELLDLLRANGFEVERLVEVQAPPDAETHAYYDDVTVEWARKWPAEEIWAARKRA